uniref:UDP-glucose/GDP-mannose dehydrogenase dimerisation domain-containing protein n=1 Tax=viral metagenome TaxID=1070528 RepID=A0A6C0J879_9ZZZZ
MNIGIIGFGVVGKAIYNTLSLKYNIIKYDKFQKLDKFIDLLNCDFVFISVPTPFDCKLNKVDLSCINESIEKLNNINYKGIIIIKSTIPPLTTDNYLKKYNLQIVFNPEFLRESTTPNEDFKNQNIVVIGCESTQIFKKVKEMYEKVLIKDAKYYKTNYKEAEMIKFSQNTLLASRVAISNIIYDCCEEIDVDYQKVKEIGFEPFSVIGSNMTQVPGPDGHRGYGGKCLPKDINGFNSLFKNNILKEIIKYNYNLRDDFGKVLKNYD